MRTGDTRSYFGHVCIISKSMRQREHDEDLDKAPKLLSVSAVRSDQHESYIVKKMYCIKKSEY